MLDRLVEIDPMRANRYRDIGELPPNLSTFWREGRETDVRKRTECIFLFLFFLFFDRFTNRSWHEIGSRFLLNQSVCDRI